MEKLEESHRQVSHSHTSTEESKRDEKHDYTPIMGKRYTEEEVLKEKEEHKGVIDEDGFTVLEDGTFFDKEGYKFDSQGYDEYGGYYENGQYNPGE